MRQVMNYERGSGGAGSMLLIVGGILILWVVWELITKALGSGVEEQRRQDRQMMQSNSRPQATPRPVNHGGVRSRDVTF